MFVMVEEGYITSWSLMPINGYDEIESSQELFGLLGSVKVVNGKAVLDEEKQKELIAASQVPSEVDQLFQLSAQSAYNQMIQATEIQRIQRQLADVTYAFMLAQRRD